MEKQTKFVSTYRLFWQSLPFILLHGSVFLLPFVFFPNLSNGLTLGKTQFFYVILLLAVFVYLLQQCTKKTFVWRQNMLGRIALLLSILVLIPSLLSWGNDAIIFGSPFQFQHHSLFFFALFLFGAILFQSPWKKNSFSTLCTLFLCSGTIGQMYLLFSQEQYLSEYTSVYAIVTLLYIALTSIFLLQTRNFLFRILLSLNLALNLSILFLIGYTPIFTFGLITTLGIIFLFSLEKIRFDAWKKIISSFLLFSFLFGIIFPHAFVSERFQQPELALTSGQTSFTIYKALKENIPQTLFGLGSGEFMTHWEAITGYALAKKVQTTSMHIRPFNTAFVVLAEQGIVFSLFVMAAFFVLCKVFVQGMQHVLQHKELRIINTVFLVWFLLSLSSFVIVYDVYLSIIWMWLLIILLRAYAQYIPGIITEKTYQWTTRIDSKVLFGVTTCVLFVGICAFVFQSGRQVAAVYAFESAREENNLNNAITLVTNAVNWDDDQATYHVTLAQLYLAKLRAEQGQQDMRLLPLETRIQMGKSIEEGILRAQRATEIAPYDVQTWNALAEMYLYLLPIEPAAAQFAESALEQSVNLRPNDANTQYQLGKLYAARGQWEDAKAAYLEAVSSEPLLGLVSISLGLLYEQEGKSEAAIDLYEQALAKGEKHVLLSYQLGRLLFNRAENDDIERAKRLWEEAITLHPGHSNSLYSLGLYYEGKGEWGKALNYFEEVLVLNPEHEGLKEKIDVLKTY